MRAQALILRLLLAITVSAAFINGSPAHGSASNSLTAGPPRGFENLASERQVVLDAYFGGQMIGEVRATVRPGFVTFDNPAALARLIPDVAFLPELTVALSGSLPSNVALACGPTRQNECGALQPSRAGIIIDEERFRVEIFVNPGLLASPDSKAASYLAEPDNRLSLISLVGATLSGSSRGDSNWHFQNRSIAAAGNIRVRSDSSLSSGSGLSFDNLTVEADRHDWRYTGGIFWAPGTDLIGRRKVFGAGVATQLDTRQDKIALMGTTLAIFLQQPAKVDLLIDGRVVSSRIYPTGNRFLDTENLPDGSYEVVLRIQEDGRPARQEQRFFTKGSLLAPHGRPLFSAFVGLLSPSGHHLSTASNMIFYEASAAYRLTPALGLDATVLGTQRKAIFEGGAIWHSRLAEVRTAALFSSSGDYGALVRASSVGKGPASFSFDLRTVKSRDGRALLPVSMSRGTFSEDPEVGFGDRGSYTQALSILGYRLRGATFRMTGLYRRNGSEGSTYSVAASFEAPVVRTSRWNLVLQADVRKTERDIASFVGVRFLANNGSLAFSGSAGVSHQSDDLGRSGRFLGEAQAAWFQQLSDQTQISTDAALGRDQDGAYARASAYSRSPAFNARADILRQFGNRNTTQYAATLNSGIAVTKGGISIAGRDINDTAVMVAVKGGVSGQKFDVLIGEAVHGTVTNGNHVLFYLQPYKTYDVRLRPREAQIARFDAAPRRVTLYPGNVTRLDWEITPLFVLFGRATGIDGNPIADADVTGLHGIGRTDENGYFQIETNGDEQLRISDRTGMACAISVNAARPVKGYVSAGDVVCR